MEKIRAFVPWKFFKSLLPFNAELLKGNAMLIRACAAKPQDGSILRSKEYLLFGNGLATILPDALVASQYLSSPRGYVMEFTEKTDGRSVRYWEVQSVASQSSGAGLLDLKVSYRPVPSDGEGYPKMLIEQPGDP